MPIRHLSWFIFLSLMPGLTMAGLLPPPEARPLLQVTGAITHTNHDDEAHLDRQLLDALPRHTLVTSTAVTDGVNRFEGFLMRTLLEHVGAEGDIAIAHALNDYLVEIPIKDFYAYDVLVADTMDGNRLTPRDKGPLWIVYPRDTHRELQDIRYDYRWVWQLYHLEIQ